MERPPDDKDIDDASYEIGKAIVSSVPVVSGPLAV